MFAAFAAGPFFIDGLSFAVAAALVLALQGSFRPQRAKAPRSATVLRDLGSDIKEGVAWLWSNTTLRTLSVMSAVVNLVLHATYAIFVLFALEILGLSEAAFGLLMVAEAVGSLLGAFVASRISHRFGSRNTILGAIALAGASNLVIGVSSQTIVVATMLVSLSVAGVVWNVITTSLRQSMVPDPLLGRVNSAHRCLAWGAIPLGALLGGFLASSFGLRLPFMVAAGALATLVVAAAFVLRTPAPAADEPVDEEPELEALAS